MSRRQLNRGHAHFFLSRRLWLLGGLTVLSLLAIGSKRAGASCPAEYPTLIPKSGSMAPGSTAYLLKFRHHDLVRVIVNGIEARLAPTTTDSRVAYEVSSFTLPTDLGPANIVIEEKEGDAFAEARSYTLSIEDVRRGSEDAQFEMRQDDEGHLTLSLPTSVTGFQLVWKEGKERGSIVLPADRRDLTKMIPIPGSNSRPTGFPVRSTEMDCFQAVVPPTANRVGVTTMSSDGTFAEPTKWVELPEDGDWLKHWFVLIGFAMLGAIGILGGARWLLRKRHQPTAS